MLSKSKTFKSFQESIDSILSKIHQKTIDGRAINPGDDEWNTSRERLMKVKVETGIMDIFPINWQLADHLIIDELTSRDKPHPEHIEFAKERN